VQNAVELFTDNKTDEYVKALTEFYERYKSKIDEESSEVYIIKTNRMGEIKLKISKENNLSLYNFLVGKLDDKIYSGIGYCATYQKILKDGLDKFKCLTTAKQVLPTFLLPYTSTLPLFLSRTACIAFNSSCLPINI